MIDVEARIKQAAAFRNYWDGLDSMESLAREVAAERNAAQEIIATMVDQNKLAGKVYRESKQELTTRAELAEARIAAMLEAAEPGNPPVDSDGTAICGLYETEEWYITDGIHARLKAIAEASR